jgi:dTMP kinase
MDQSMLGALEKVTLAGLKPDLTLMLDLPAEDGLARATARRGAGASDRFEAERIGFHRRLRQAFLDIAAADPARCVVLDASLAPDEIRELALAACAAHGLEACDMEAGAPAASLPEAGA